MFVIDVIPLKRGIQISTLSYFSSTPYAIGTLLNIPLRNSSSRGVVVETKEVGAAKTALRAATFSLRRLPEQETTKALSPILLRATDEIKEFYASTRGAVLFALLPNEIKNGKIPPPISSNQEGNSEHKTLILEASTKTRYIEYSRLVRESFANGKSVVIVSPSSGDTTKILEEIDTGIKSHIVVLSSTRGIKALRIEYERIVESEHPLCILASPQYAFIDRDDIGVVILERSRGQGYRGVSRPFIDYRYALEIHARHHKRVFISADTLIRTEDEYLLRTEKALPFGEHPNRIELSGKLNVVYMIDPPDGNVAFKLFSDELLEAIENNMKKRKQTLLFAPRRGLAPVVACVDCGHILRSPDSGTPLSLHRTVGKDGQEERWLVCSTSGYKAKAYDLCPSCSSWRLRERGIGIQHIYDELTELIPEASVTLFDYTTAHTKKSAERLIEEFYAHKGGILLGTALSFPYLKKPVGLSAIVNMDGLRAIPSWRQQENVFGTILTLREITKGDVIIQTRTTTDDELLTIATHGDTQIFYNDELSVRESWNYPPFSVFIHFTWRGNHQTNLETARELEELFNTENIVVYASPLSEGDVHEYHALIRMNASEWPHDEVVDKIRSLPPSVRVIINPDRIV